MPSTILARLFLAVAVMLAAAGAAPAPAWAQAQDKGEFLFAKPPEGWKLGYQNDEGTQRVREYIPEGEKVEDWTNMIVVQVFGNKGHIAPKDLAAGMFTNYQRGCAKAEFGMKVEGTQNGYDVFSVMIQCKDPKPRADNPNLAPRKLEVNWVKIIRGANTLYVVQRQWRADQPGPDYPLTSRDALKPWAEFMRATELCDVNDIKRTCRFMGHISDLEAQVYARRLPSPYADQACSYFVTLVVRPDPAREMQARAVVPIMLGVDPFLSDDNGKKAFEQVAAQAANNAGVALIFTVGKAATAGLAVDFEKARGQSRAVREALAARGIDAARMVEVFNPACSG
ncbi:MAG: hypothetical protein H6907_05295 [Hyphomicrobiales bacterium]|nr:hypothetical protein [Hyphomicrobiales bacterium]MCP5371131.1 hypothetical protein [Hyphomicrobiales bacterium]